VTKTYCKYCNKEFEGRGVSGHTSNCLLNPNRTIRNFKNMNKLADEAKLTEAIKLKRSNPIFGTAFKHMMDRVKLYKLDCSYTRDEKGFIEFVKDIGEVPLTIKKPSVGRKDHSKGYVKGNFNWQERSENSYEAAKRIGFGSKIKGGRKNKSLSFSEPITIHSKL